MLITMPKSLKKPVGIAPLAIVVIIGALIAAGIGGFFLLKRQGIITTPKVSLFPSATEKDFDFIADPILRKHLAAQSNQRSYRTKTYSSGADLNLTNEYQFKGENLNTREIQLNPSGKEIKHKIQIADTIYIKDFTDNKWWKQTITPEVQEEVPKEEKPEEPVDFKAEYSKPDLQFKSLGKEACDNLMCYKYEQLTGGSEEMAFKRIFWFDDKKFLLRKEETTVGEFTVSSQYSYDVNIIPPSPTKDVPEGRSIFEYENTPLTPSTPVQNYPVPNYQAPTDFPNPEDSNPPPDSEIGY